MNRFLPLLLLCALLTACSDSTGSSTLSAADVWRVTTVNGVALPVPTPDGQTLTNVNLFLQGRANDTGGVGSLSVCLSAHDTVSDSVLTVLWSQTGDTVFLTYRDLEGAPL